MSNSNSQGKRLTLTESIADRAARDLPGLVEHFENADSVLAAINDFQGELNKFVNTNLPFNLPGIVLPFQAGYFLRIIGQYNPAIVDLNFKLAIALLSASGFGEISAASFRLFVEDWTVSEIRTVQEIQAAINYLNLLQEKCEGQNQ